MSTTLANSRKGLSKELGDYWDSTLTENGTSTTIVDTLLTAKSNDWISDAPQEHYALITSGTYDGIERRLTSLSASAGTLTSVTSFGGTLLSGVSYEVHRLFSAADKKLALIYAAKAAFPSLFRKVRDTSLTVGNWLRDPSFEFSWTSSALNTYWVASTATQAKNTTAPYYTQGSTSLKLSGAAGYTAQSNTQNSDLMSLAGYSVTFEANVWSDVASDTRLSIYDGTTTTYSSYHTGGSTFEELSVTASIASSPSQVRFALHRGATSTVYMDEASVTGPTRDKIYIGDLSLALDYPHSVEQSSPESIDIEPWQVLRRYEIGSDGYLYLHEGSEGYVLRIKGIGYLDFLASGVSSTAWTATIEVDEPQIKILYAEAVMYLYRQMILPNFTSGDREDFAKMLAVWENELTTRRMKFGMKPPLANVRWT